MSPKTEILIGPAGSGKSKRYYEELVDRAFRHPEQQFYLIVPEQAGSSMEQRILSINRERTGREGFFNIDIIGFSRLAYRVFEEQGRSMRKVLEDYGKVILLRSVVAKVKDQLQLYRGSVDRQGFIDELKSLFSEFLLFDIRPEDLEAVEHKLPEEQEVLRRKLSDVGLVYRTFRENEVFLSEYMVAEELPAYLARLLSEPGDIRSVDGCSFLFDGFTGFTAEQRKVLLAMRSRAAELQFTITMEPSEKEDPLFSQSKEMLDQLLTIFPEAKVLEQPAQPADSALRHLTRHVFRFPVHEYKTPVSEELRIWRTENPVEELRVVAEDIRSRVLRGELRYRDTAILTADLAGLCSFLDPVMQEYGLPYFSDHTRSFTNNPIIDAQLAVLELLDRDFAYESVFAFLKTGVLDRALTEAGMEADAVELLENFVLAHGIRGRKLWEKEAEYFVRKDRRTEGEELILSEVEEVRQLLLDVMSPVLRFRGRKEYPVQDMIRGLLEIAADPRLHMEERGEAASDELLDMGYPAEARAYRGIHQRYRSVLEKTAAILGDQQMTVHDLRETLLIGAGEIRVGVIPPTLDSVLVGDLERTRIGAVRVLYIVNLCDGILPKPKSRASILSDQDRTLMGQSLVGKELAPDETTKRFREQFSLYLAMSKPTESLTLSYSARTGNGKEQEKSFLLGRIQRVFPKLEEEVRVRRTLSGAGIPDRMEYLSLLRKEAEEGLSDEERLRLEVLGRTFPEVPRELPREPQGEEALPEELMKALTVKISVSQLEKYANCPYAYFLQYILRLYPRDEHKIRELDIGNILHRTLELTFRRVKTEHGNNWDSLPEEALLKLMRESIRDAILEEKPTLSEEELRDGKTALVLQQLEELAERNLEILSGQLKDGRMLPEVMEGQFRAEFDAKRPDGATESVRITGFVDRLDTFRAEDGTVFLRILDYKTGEKKLELRDIRDGRNLQLAVYLRILTEIFSKQEGSCIPAGMYYYHVDQPVLTELAKGRSDEEEAARVKTEQKLRLRGIPNVSPTEEEESGFPKHFAVELQERDALDENRELLKARVLPIDVNKEHQPMNSTILASTEDMQGIEDYSLYKMKSMTEQILRGEIGKKPTRKAGQQDNSCKYCTAAAVCRFRKGDSPEQFVPKESDQRELIKALVETGTKQRVTLRGARLLEEQDPEHLLTLREDADEDTVEEG